MQSPKFASGYISLEH